jgi:FkbM family methyltransferase
MKTAKNVDPGLKRVRFPQMIKSWTKDVIESVAPSLGVAYRRRRDQRLAALPFADTPYGFRLSASKAMTSGAFERDEVELFLAQLEFATTCIDIGANIGLYSCLAASRGKRVLAVEPMQRNLQALYRNLSVNGYADVEVFPMGLSSEPGIKRIYGGGTGASFLPGWARTPESWSSIVSVTTLDIIAGTRLDDVSMLIKMDVEGFESEVLKGAAHVLSLDPKPRWLVEIGVSEHFPGGVNAKFAETFELFWHHGYTAHIAHPSLRVVEPKDVERWARDGQVGFGSGNYMFFGA